MYNRACIKDITQLFLNSPKQLLNENENIYITLEELKDDNTLKSLWGNELSVL